MSGQLQMSKSWQKSLESKKNENHSNLNKDIAIVAGAGCLLPAAVRGVKLAAEEVGGAIFQGIWSILVVLQDILSVV